MPELATIRDVQAAGYTAELASGSVRTEEDALARAREAASPGSVREDADEVARETARQAMAQGARGQELARIIATATGAALERMQVARDERVAFHERALAAAMASPDVWAVSAVGDPATPDDDVRLYVCCRADGTGWDAQAQETLDLLAATPQP